MALSAPLHRSRPARVVEASSPFLTRVGNAAEVVPIPMAVVDLSGEIVSWNPAAEELYGTPASQAVGAFAGSTIGWNEIDDVGRELDAGRTSTRVMEVGRRDGSRFTAELTFRAILDARSARQGLVIVANDVTEREREDGARRAFTQLLIDSQAIAGFGSWVLEMETGEVTWSAETYQIFGLDPAAPAPDLAGVLAHENDSDAVRAALERSIGSGAPFVHTARIRRPDGKIRWIEVAALPSLVDGAVVRVVGSVLDVTSRETSHARHRASEARYKMVVETVREAIWVVDADGVTTFANDRLADLLGRPIDDLIGTSVMDLVDEEGAATAVASFAVLREGQPNCFDVPFLRPDGRWVWTLLSAAPIFEGGSYMGALAMLTDITDRHRIEVDLQEGRERLAEAQKLALLGNWTFDLTTDSATCSDEFYRLMTLDPADGPPSLDRAMSVIHPDDRARAQGFIDEVRVGPGAAAVELRVVAPDGAERWLAMRGTPRLDGAGRALEMRGTVQDISERKTAEVQLSHLALHDTLTGLPNRFAFVDRLTAALARSEGAVTVMVIDLDGFKAINDSLGHTAGDVVLATVASRLRAAIRPTEMLARFAGDEFTVLVETVDEAVSVGVAERLLATLGASIHVDGRNLLVQASIGIGVGAGTPESADELLRKADTAMHAAKGRGGGSHEVFRAHMHEVMAERRALERDLRDIDLGSEMVLHYQPVVDLADGRLCGFEGLLRWDHPQRGRISPGDFIPLAEATGAIIPIGRWVVQEACRQVVAWQSDHPRAPSLSMNVNVSARQLGDPDLVADVAEALHRSGLDPALLTLEITETMMLTDEDEVSERLGELKALGVRISVDDFGTGYSSIGHLERFPIDELKIDRSFVASIGGDSADASVASGVIRLARSLRIEVVAEGIERVEQLAELRRLKCTRGQGFYLSTPLDPASVGVLLANVSHYAMPASPRRILVVDDDDAVRRSTSRILCAAGHDVVQAGTGADALRIAGETRLDAIVLDVALPDIDGFEICRRLGEMSLGDLPILHLSGAAVALDDRVRGLDMGAEAYLLKPVAPKELLAVVGALLRSRDGSLRA